MENLLSNVVTPLYGHSSRETAYHVGDYPYGRLRCEISFWLESNNRGWRFVSQTINPKNGRVNAPKCGTYSKFAGCMFLDTVGHCTYAVCHEYSTPEYCMEFASKFPQADLRVLREWATAKVRYNARLPDSPYITTEERQQWRALAELLGWEQQT